MDRTSAITKVRALQAHALSTPYEAEAESYWAKANQLCTSHQITADDLIDEAETNGWLSGLFGWMRDPEWAQIQEDRRTLFAQVEAAVHAALDRGHRIQNPRYKLEYFQHLHDHVRDLKDSHKYAKDDAGKYQTIPGIREARDRAIADLFTRFAIQINSERHDIWSYQGDSEWVSFVKDEAEERVSFAYPGTVRRSTIQAAINRVNGYIYFWNTLFPKYTCTDITKPAWEQRKEA